MIRKNIYIVGCLIFTISSSFLLSAQQRHYIDVWGGGGYSALLHGIENTKVPG